MTITEAEREQLRQEFAAEAKRKLSERMALLGRSKSAKKKRASRRNAKLAVAARRLHGQRAH